ncbi:hypothetical protein PS634_04875 [Pseudomonas fluorescens]|nr:hypothetical protein PS634_04875 [Pseudomonas fluorescens]
MCMKFLKSWSGKPAIELGDTETLLPPNFGISQISFFSVQRPTAKALYPDRS